MNTLKNNIKLAGFLIILGMITGILSIASAVDSPNYLTEAAANATQVSTAALFQFVLCLTYLGFAILLYPIVKKHNERLALGFLSFRIIAGVILIIGTVILLSILAVSQEFVKITSENQMAFEAFGNVLKSTRDYINHIFMVFTIGAGNLMVYILFLKAKLIPKWLSVWGILGTILSIVASVLLLFGIVEVITVEYLALNVPTGLFELVLGIRLIFKGFNSQGPKKKAILK
ncbi:DUF4386 domain-containing protein [Gaetbulibacter sp. PBL-D1]|uniref:DUF4386 domain-containing protein n=1 Tax=Gaetbulibacter sp. PBL-D1 TaxID=3422594 RepID=UPI003D2EFD0C